MKNKIKLAILDNKVEEAINKVNNNLTVQINIRKLKQIKINYKVWRLNKIKYIIMQI